MSDENALLEEAAPANRLQETALNEQHDEAKKFREFVIDDPQPPWHMHLVPPVEFDGQKYTELTFDFDALIAKDFIRAQRTFNKLYRPEKNETVLPEMMHVYHCILAAQVADVPVGLIMKLPRRQYVPVRLQVLKACGSSSEEETA